MYRSTCCRNSHSLNLNDLLHRSTLVLPSQRSADLNLSSSQPVSRSRARTGQPNPGAAEHARQVNVQAMYDADPPINISSATWRDDPALSERNWVLLDNFHTRMKSKNCNNAGKTRDPDLAWSHSEAYGSAWENCNLRSIDTYRSCTKGLQRTAYLHLEDCNVKYTKAMKG
jgi:hypothetical protein